MDELNTHTSFRWNNDDKKLIITTQAQQLVLNPQQVYDLLEHLYQWRIEIMDAAHEMPGWARPGDETPTRPRLEQGNQE